MSPTEFGRQAVEGLGLSVGGLREIVGEGEANYVFVASTRDGELVVRFHRDPLDTDDYSAEEWCLRHAEVPVPEFVARGSLGGRAYIVQRFVPGMGGDEVRTPDLWRVLGGYARKINEFEVGPSAPDALFSRFGRDLGNSWRQHLAYNLGELTPEDPLIRAGVYEQRHQERIRRVFEGLVNSVEHFGLTHGDLVPKNVLLAETGQVVVLDWGSATTGPVPFADFGRICYDDAREGFHRGDVDAFAEGYGIGMEGLRETLGAIRLLGKIDVCRWARDRRPDRFDSYVRDGSLAVQVALDRGLA